MKTTVEISMYPLNADYIPIISDFIERLNTYNNIKIKTNATSTHITGDYDYVLDLLKDEIKTSFQKHGKSVMVMKIINGELDI